MNANRKSKKQGRIAKISNHFTFDPDRYIIGYFAKIKDQVNSRILYLNEQIDKYADKLVESVNENQQTCLRVREIGDLKYPLIGEVYKLRKDPDELKRKFDS